LDRQNGAQQLVRLARVGGNVGVGVQAEQLWTDFVLLVFDNFDLVSLLQVILRDFVKALVVK